MLPLRQVSRASASSGSASSARPCRDEPLAVLEERHREPERQPELAECRGCRFQALLDLVVLAAGSCTHLDQTRGGVELLVPPACDAFGSRVRRCQTPALGLSLAPERAAGYAQPPPCPVGSCGRATRSLRSLRAACGAACGLPLRAQQERAKPRSSRKSVRALAQILPLPKCPARKPQPRRTLPFSHALPRARPCSAPVVARPACPEADVAEEPNSDTQVRVRVVGDKGECPARLRLPRRTLGGGESGRARELIATRAVFSAFLLCTERQSTGRAARRPQRAKTSCGASTGTHRHGGGCA